VAACASLGGLGNPAASALVTAPAVVDVSGGDSFTDLYGPRRFTSITWPKQIVLKAKRPLILLPQTLGPFSSEPCRDIAKSILSQAASVWVRDRQSEITLQNILDDQYDPQIHRRSPDMAVLLPARRPAVLPITLASWLTESRDFPVAGLNVSGLLWQAETSAQAQFGLRASHRDQAFAIACTVLESDPAMRLLLVPHVKRPAGDSESDQEAAEQLLEKLRDRYPTRVQVVSQDFNECELKWIISHLDWFSGARMHSTIAGFSSGVPTLGLGYSDKAAGVFTECGLAEHVADLRHLSTRDLVARVTTSLALRNCTRLEIKRGLNWVKARADAAMDMIASEITGAVADRNAA
jgi:polysaccharide pyruvyl transferase WcaK-like protein